MYYFILILKMKQIIHISDLHIRNGDNISCRYDEYLNVFDNLIISINNEIINSKINKNEYIIVITGDIFHNKTNIGSYGLYLYKLLITKLIEITKVVIIQGNHDISQSDAEQPSLLYASSFVNKNLYILNETSTLIIDNIGFSHVAIQDTLNSKKTSGRLENLPDFPEIIETVDYKIALFHGTMNSVKINNLKIADDTMHPYPFEWIKDFEYILLGDIHLRQKGTYKEKSLWAYSGSLIQQNYGENIIDHGYIIWNLENKTIKEVNVYNDKGYIYLKEEHEIIKINYKNNFICLDTFIKQNLDYFPKKLEIKLITSLNYKNLNSIFKKYNVEYNIISNKLCDYTDSTDIEITDELDNKDTTIMDFNDSQYIQEYFKKIITEQQSLKLNNWLKNKDTLLFDIDNVPLSIKDDCIKNNKEINTAINNCLKSDDVDTIKKPFIIKYIEWNNLYCYEGNNYINFQDIDLKTFLIKGENGIGKSAIYDVIVLALFGETINSKQCTTLSAGIINHNCDTANTIIILKIDEDEYKIERNFTRFKDTDKINKSKVVFSKLNDVNKKIKKEDNATKDLIAKLFGTVEQFLSSSMVTQNIDYDILKQDYKDSLSIIDKSANLTNIYNLYNLFKNCSKKYNDTIKIIDAKLQVYSKLVTSDIILNKTELNEIKIKVNELIEFKDKLKIEYDSLYEVDLNRKDLNIILNTDYPDNIYQDITLEKYNELIDNIKKLYKYENDYQTKYKEYNDVIKDKFKLYNDIVLLKPCEFSFIENKKKLLLKYIEPSKPDDIDINKFKEKYDIVKKKLKFINDNKPKTINKPKEELTIITAKILKHYKKIDELFNYCKDNQRKDIKDIKNIKKIYKYNDILKLQKEFNDISTLIANNNNKITIIDADISNLQKDNIKYNKTLKCPLISYNDVIEFHKIIKNYNDTDIKNKQKLKNKNETKLNNLYKLITLKENKEEDLKKYDNELLMLNTSDDYKYNPCCEYCCKRPWVLRIKELNELILKIKTEINDLNTIIYNGDEDNYIELFNKNEELKLFLNEYDNNKIKENEYNLLLNEWNEYNKINELLLKNHELLDNQIKDKDNILKNTITLNIKQNDLQDILDMFNYISYEFYDIYVNIKDYEIYEKWFNDYNIKTNEYDELVIKIKEIDDYLYYINEIKPRKDDLILLEDKYNKWIEYDNINNIVKSYELYSLKLQQNDYDMRNDIIINKRLKPLIKRKIELTNLIKENDLLYTETNNNYIKFKTEYEYNINNKNELDTLKSYLIDIKDNINVIEIITSKFVDYRIWIYDLYILPNIVNSCNKIINKVCHKDTKSFKINYIINTFSKDNIHINWLIDIPTDTKKQHLISIQQASGFQRFIISLAIRLTLSLNKNNCKQLFIDEGFVACDSNNISLVPSFLKSLLNYYNSIIIVSHINIIQDNIEESININRIGNKSYIQFGDKLLKK